MNNYPSKEVIERLRKQYPSGSRVELDRMSDPYTKLKPGDKGTVSWVDDIGTIHVNWDCGSTLGVAFGEDSCRLAESSATPPRHSGMDEIIVEQILAIRKTGETNMFDVLRVKEIALREGCFELLDFLEKDVAAYARFILTGE